MTTASYEDIAGQAPSLATTADLVAAQGPDLSGRGPWLFTGSGASYHAATTAAAMARAVGGLDAASAPAAEVWMNPDLWVRAGGVVVALSRTGTTTETVQALRTAASVPDVSTVGASLTADTELLVEADHGLALTHVGERGRVMTRSFANLLLASEVLAFRAAGAAGMPYATAAPAVAAAVADGMAAFDAAAAKLATQPTEHVVFLGSGPDIGLGHQAALQLQETSRLWVEAHSVLDYRHGPIAALTRDTTVVVLTSERSLAADLVVADDVDVLGARAVVVGAPDLLASFPDTVDGVPVPGDLPRWLGGNVALPFLQLFAYHLTVARGADPESVTNLDRTKDPHVNPHVLPTTLFGSVTGSVPGSVTGSVAGSVAGSVTGSDTGTDTGTDTGFDTA